MRARDYEVIILEHGNGFSIFSPYAPCKHNFQEKSIEECLSKEFIECTDCGIMLKYNRINPSFCQSHKPPDLK